MAKSTFRVPPGAKLEILYKATKTDSLTVGFLADGNADPQLLVVDGGDSDNGEHIPFLVVDAPGTLKVVSTGIAVQGIVPTSEVTVYASPYFTAKYVLRGSAVTQEVRIEVSGGRA